MLMVISILITDRNAVLDKCDIDFQESKPFGYEADLVPKDVFDKFLQANDLIERHDKDDDETGMVFCSLIKDGKTIGFTAY